jgi:hypothetical protein
LQFKLIEDDLHQAACCTFANYSAMVLACWCPHVMEHNDDPQQTLARSYIHWL